MYALVQNNVVQRIHRGGGITIGNTQYPPNIFTLWSKAELATIGLLPVEQATLTEEQVLYHDNTFSYAVEGNKVVESVSSKPKPDKTALMDAERLRKAKSDLKATDQAFIRVAEEIVDRLIAGDTSLSGLSEDAKTKIAQRKALRDGLNPKK